MIKYYIIIIMRYKFENLLINKLYIYLQFLKNI